VFAINLSSASPIDSSKVNTHSNEKTIEESASLELTAEDVIEKYLEAIGGRKQIESMADRSTTMSGTTMGKTLGIVVKQKAPSMLRQEINTGTIKQTIIFDGEKGVMLMGEQKSELGGNELDKLKIEAQMNFLLNPESFGVRPDLIGIEIIDSVQCYNISMNMDDSTNWNQYYEVKSGLKIKEIKGVETPQGIFEQESLFSDYREVDGLKFPFKITQTLGAQTIELNIEMIEINTGLQDVLFEIPE
jgi:outer membrane lipoprotein-sorting protein